MPLRISFPRPMYSYVWSIRCETALKYASHVDFKPLVKDLKKIIYRFKRTGSRPILGTGREKWGKKYKVIFRSWNNNWVRLTNFYKYPPALRRVIYTNNPIESYHRMVHRTTKTKGTFTSENAIVKQLYLATVNAQTRWNGTMFAWTSVRRDLVDYFENRFLTDDTL